MQFNDVNADINHVGNVAVVRKVVMDTIDAFQQPIIRQFFEKLLPLSTEKQSFENRYEHIESKNELMPDWVHNMADLIHGKEKFSRDPPIIFKSTINEEELSPNKNCDPSSLYVSFDYITVSTFNHLVSFITFSLLAME